MFKNFPILMLIVFSGFWSSAFGSTPQGNLHSSYCLQSSDIASYRSACLSSGSNSVFAIQSGVPCSVSGYIPTVCVSNSTCPAGQRLSTLVNGDGFAFTSCVSFVDTPQECGITGLPVWNGNGYDCVEDFNTPCPDGTVNGMYTMPGYDPRPYCTDGNPPASSASSTASSSGQNSSSNNSDGNGDGSGSSSGDTGNSSSASSTGGGGNSSGSASSGGGGSGVSGECDPTSKNYLECLNTKELEIPSEKGSYDGTGGTSTEDRIGELEGELQGVVDQIKSEINDTIGVSLSGGGTLTDQCYQIMKVQVCFGWARWSQHLALIANAILAMAYIASFIIIMRQ